jgi:hypothetical protein
VVEDLDWRKTLSTPTPAPATPTIPLPADVRAAYEAVYAKTQAAIVGTTDFTLLTALNATRDDIGGLISADDQYRISQNTAQFEALLKSINATNAGLKTLQTTIAGVAVKIGRFGEVAGAINKVLSLVPGI